MKNLLILSNFLLIGVIVLMHSCSNSTEKSDNQTDRNPKREAFTSVSLEEFVSDIARYKTTHSDLINSQDFYKNLTYKGKHFQDARSCWFSIKTLKQFIDTIEYASKNKGVNLDGLGIRFYYGAYSEKTDLNSSNYDSLNAFHHTLFLVPTYSNGKPDENVDFDPRDNKYKTLAEKIERTIPRQNKNGAQIRSLILNVSITNSSATIKNQGQLCPAACDNASANTLQTIDNLK